VEGYAMVGLAQEGVAPRCAIEATWARKGKSGLRRLTKATRHPNGIWMTIAELMTALERAS